MNIFYLDKDPEFLLKLLGIKTETNNIIKNMEKREEKKA
tara:strand:- start:1280 stop:1396 length:117 start_codon:yes stop_codon:yes gene_type:complete